MKTRLLLIIGIIFALGFIETAFACLCDELTIEQRINQADVIFSGTINGNTWEHSEKYIAAGFDVQVVWKGADSFPLIETGNVAVITAKTSTACGVNFIQDKEYMIYAKIDGNNLQTATCDGSWFLDGRGDDIKALDEIGSTHHFVDARKAKWTTVECGGPGFTSKEQCEYNNLVRQVFLPLAIAFPIVGISVFLICRKRK